MDRRSLLVTGAALAAGALAGCSDNEPRPGTRHTAAPGHGSGHATVGAEEKVPGGIVVTGRQLVSGQVAAKGVFVSPDAVYEFDPDKSTTLTVTGNIVVRGTLRMRPSNPSVVHEIRFRDIDESKFVGELATPVQTDVGLWVVGAGVLDLEGTRRAGWNRTGSDPTWRAGDDILRAPNAVGDYDKYLAHSPGSSVPEVTGPNGVSYATEVFNLTRNVIIGGEEDARAHVMIGSSSPQRIRFVLFRWMGPRRPSPGTNANTEPVLSRYPLHFHYCDDGSRGSVVEGCVVRDSSRAFVPHSSHGITMRDCIAHRILDDAFWWDERDLTHDLLWEHCAVFDVRYDPEFRGKVAGFLLGMGSRMKIHDCVAVGVHGSGDDAGFQWPSFANQKANNVWDSTDLVAHNCRGDGVFVWQNDNSSHLVKRVVCYRNGQSGLQHGAYRNTFRYEDLVLFDNQDADLSHQAMPKDSGNRTQDQSWHHVWAPHLLISDHAAPSSVPVRFHDLKVDRVTVNEWKSGSGTYILHADLTRQDFEIIDKKSTIKVVPPNGGSAFLV